MPTLAVQNHSTVLDDAAIRAYLPDLQAALTEDFAPYYGDAKLAWVDATNAAPPGSWPFNIFDDSDQAGALGYHINQTGIPEARVFVKSDIAAGMNWQVTVAHEAQEMTADPWVASVALVDYALGGFFGGSIAAIAWETSDAPEADAYAYRKGQSMISDFVLPWWFGAVAPPADVAGQRYSFTGAIREPFSIDRHAGVHGLLPGGYIGIRTMKRPTNWATVSAAAVPTLAAAETFRRRLDAMLPPEQAHILKADGSLDVNPPVGSRRYLRLQKMG